jgi:hypothetical protein
VTADIGHLPIPEYHRTPLAAIGTARNLVDREEVRSVLILGETAEGLLFLSAGDGRQLTSAEALWLLEWAKALLLDRGRFEGIG